MSDAPKSFEQELDESKEKFRKALFNTFSAIPGFNETPVRRFVEKRCQNCEILTLQVELEDDVEWEITLCPGKPLQIEQVYP